MLLKKRLLYYFLITSFTSAVTYSFSWTSPTLKYPERAITTELHRRDFVRGANAKLGTSTTITSKVRRETIFTTHIVVLRPFMARLSNDEKKLNGSDVWQEEDDQPSRIDDQDSEVKRPTLFGLEPKQEVDPLDNGLPVLGPIIFFLQFYIAYLLFAEVPLTEIQDAIP
jgi:hypothetical protein